LTDAEHANVPGVWDKMRSEGQDWPDEGQWAQLTDADRLDEFEPTSQVTAAADGTLSLEFTLPMPAMSFVELVRA